ncbi:hypothetical protein N865_05025 [Intrasporangium oryzae NRRL B-24470]|uniref:Aminoglycoside phosphotransferase domain-containing protein n=1 Tax=Intrasporangium oryzae NRRL B-24470 TaxID=1386089 RepID=W9GF95_9MICO|nr:phosphotransferase [Intrasporangium oryzae]EWT02514.1 hypothetical protein N865_05025 [Intrasporangium oryzae NRRL B-24470]
MGGRTVLGAADVSDELLATMVASSLGVGRVELVTTEAEVFPYDLDALTTAGRFWVRGTARVVDPGDGALPAVSTAPFAFFVKVVQSWARSPLFAMVPEPMREAALRMVPWRTEPEVYRSSLEAALPAGLRMPRALGVVDLDELSAAVWLMPVAIRSVPWDHDRHVRAARLLGRLAASPAVRPYSEAAAQQGGRSVRDYAAGRLEHLILPALRSDELWEHPLVSEAFRDELRGRLRAAADAVPAYLGELDAVPLGTSHGDACTRNLLVTDADDGFTLIDFGFWGRSQLGADLGQLLLGEVQMGERPARELPALEAACLTAYVEGLRDEGCDADAGVVRRSHALLMLLFSGLSAVPFEHLGRTPTAELRRLADERARSARFILDLVDATQPVG